MPERIHVSQKSARKFVAPQPYSEPHPELSQPSAEHQVMQAVRGSAPLTPPTVLRLQRMIGNRAVQQIVGRKSHRVQRAIQVQLNTEQNATPLEHIIDLCYKFGIDLKAFSATMVQQLFTSNLFPNTYTTSYPNNPTLQIEMDKVIEGLSGLMEASTSQTILNAATGDVNGVTTQLYAILSPDITAVWLHKRAPFLKNANTLTPLQAPRYLAFLKLMKEKLDEYSERAQRAKNDEQAKTMENRTKVFKPMALTLLRELNDAIALKPNTRTIDEILGDIDQLGADLRVLEPAWDLDYLAESRDLETKVETDLANDEGLGDKYKREGGTTDEVDLAPEYNAQLACTLYAILTVKPGWLGATHPIELDAILRRTGQLRNYDDDRTVAKIRYLAGLKPTTVSDKNMGVPSFVQWKATQQGNKVDFIVDAEGLAHTFAAHWDGKKYVKIDEQTPEGGTFSKYTTNKVLAIWTA